MQKLTQINHVHEQKDQNNEKKTHVHDVWRLWKNKKDVDTEKMKIFLRQQWREGGIVFKRF